MIYQRPTKQSLDLWVNETGDPSYVRIQLSKYFISSFRTNNASVRLLTPSSHTSRKAEASRLLDQIVQQTQHLDTMVTLLSPLAARSRYNRLYKEVTSLIPFAGLIPKLCATLQQ